MSFIKWFRLAPLAILVSGCATAHQTYLPDGSKGYSISCDGAAVGINVCFEKAGEICGAAGYKLIGREGQIVPYGVGSANIQGGTNAIHGQSFVTYGAFNTKSIMVRCNK